MIAPVAAGIRRLRNSTARSQSPKATRLSARARINMPTNIPLAPKSPSKSSRALTRPSFGSHPLPRPGNKISNIAYDEDDDEEPPLSTRRAESESVTGSKASGLQAHDGTLLENNIKPLSRPSRVDDYDAALHRSSGSSQDQPMSDDSSEFEVESDASPPDSDSREAQRHSSKDDRELPRRSSSGKVRSSSSSRKKRSSREKVSSSSTKQPHDKRPSRPSQKSRGSKPDAVEAEPSKPESHRSSENKQYSKLDKQSLQNMQDLKDSIKQMRTSHRKVKFDGESSMTSPTPARTSVGSSILASPTHTAVSSSMFNSSGSLSREFNSSLTGFGEITMDDLEVGFFNKQQQHSTLLQQQQIQQDIQAASLQKQIKKKKKLMKRTCNDVWSEREEITNLQRKNWSIRKTLMQTDAPQDSVTTHNLKIEKVVRQERELDMDIDLIDEEKHFLEEDCSELAKAIGHVKELLDKLNREIVPLLPTEKELAQRMNSEHDELADTIHSTVADDDEEEGSMSLSHLRILSPAG